MEKNMKIASLHQKAGKKTAIEKYTFEQAEKVQRFHQSFPEYAETPLVDLKNLAQKLGVGSIYVKDESYRFGLNAFKVLGGSYCIANYIAQKTGTSMEELTYSKLISDEMKEKTKDLTFITATDGNHGRGIAWTANKLGYQSIVYMPKGSVEERLENIKAFATEAKITEYNYDATVRQAKKDAQDHHWILVQDTSWEGYEEIPSWIMQGYLTMGYEIISQIEREQLQPPTHIFLQAGVGSMAAAMAAFFANVYQEKKPIITIVEPDQADCFYQTADADDGKLHIVEGDMKTMMAGLACGEPCTIAWDILHDYAEHYISMPDDPVRRAMRVLGNPIADDSPIVSGESGASGMGFVIEVLQNPEYEWMKKKLQVTSESRILCISTEGDTDTRNYKRIMMEE